MILTLLAYGYWKSKHGAPVSLEEPSRQYQSNGPSASDKDSATESDSESYSESESITSSSETSSETDDNLDGRSLTKEEAEKELAKLTTELKILTHRNAKQRRNDKKANVTRKTMKKCGSRPTKNKTKKIQNAKKIVGLKKEKTATNDRTAYDLFVEGVQKEHMVEMVWY